MTQRAESRKTETVAEYLARGGKVTKLPRGGELEPLSFVGPSAKPKKRKDAEDLQDGNSPNLKWIGGN